MARKTPEEAALTRQRIVDAARTLFYTKGVEVTTLEQIAKASGVTRGAVYWHFEDKGALINELRLQLTQMFTEQVDAFLLDETRLDALTALEQGLKKLFLILEENSTVREILAIWFGQGSFVNALPDSTQAVAKCHQDFIAKIYSVYVRAIEKGSVRKGVSAHILALDTDAFVVGLIRNWLLNVDQVKIREQVSEIIAAHIELRRP